MNVFCYENKLVFPIHVSNQKFENSIDLQLVIDDAKSHYVYIKDFNRFMFHKMKNKNKKHFCKSCLQCFSSKNVLTKHKEICLNINGAQCIRLEKGMIEFKNYSKKIPVPFKIYADFESNLEDVEIYEGSYLKKYQDHVPCSFAYKLVCIDDRFNKQIVVFKGKNAAYEIIKAILKEYEQFFSFLLMGNLLLEGITHVKKISKKKPTFKRFLAQINSLGTNNWDESVVEGTLRNLRTK